MCLLTAQWNSTCEEDTALQRCNRNDGPRARTEARASDPYAAARTSLPPNHPQCPLLRDWHPSDKPSRHAAATPPTRCRPFDNTHQPKFHFPLNQDTVTSRMKV